MQRQAQGRPEGLPNNKEYLGFGQSKVKSGRLLEKYSMGAMNNLVLQLVDGSLHAARSAKRSLKIAAADIDPYPNKCTLAGPD
jgi:hypothetical protein